MNLGHAEDDFEFVELVNTSLDTIHLDGLKFTAGIIFDFSGGSVRQLDPGQRVVVVSDLAGFQARYGSAAGVAGEYAGLLANAGERLTLADRYGNTLADFLYGDSGDWPGRADGRGSSLEATTLIGDLGDPGSWRSSHDYGGSPGRAGTKPFGDVVINEVLTYPTGAGQDTQDFVELHNVTAAPLNIGGWYLSNLRDNYLLYQVAAADPRSSIPPGGFSIFYAAELGFSLDSGVAGEVWLLQGESGRLTRFADHSRIRPGGGAGPALRTPASRLAPGRGRTVRILAGRRRTVGHAPLRHAGRPQQQPLQRSGRPAVGDHRTDGGEQGHAGRYRRPVLRLDRSAQPDRLCHRPGRLVPDQHGRQFEEMAVPGPDAWSRAAT